MDRGRSERGRYRKKGRRFSGKNHQPNSSQFELNMDENSDQRNNFMYRSFSGGQEIDGNQLLYNQRISGGYRNHRQFRQPQFNANFEGNRFENQWQKNLSGVSSRNAPLLNSEYESVPNINSLPDPYYETVGAYSLGAVSNNRDVNNSDKNGESNNSNFPTNSASFISMGKNEIATLMEAKRNFELALKNLKPCDIILDYRHRVDEIVHQSVKRNLCAIDEISKWESKNKKVDMKSLHVQNLHLQREEFENYVSKVKQELSSLSTSDTFTTSDNHIILKSADSVLSDVKDECKLFNRFLPGYSQKSTILSKLNENQILIISTDSSYYLNVVLPIFLKKNYSNHLLFSCEANELLKSNLKLNINYCLSKDIEDGAPRSKSEIQCLTDNEMLSMLLKGNLDNFIAICNLPMKRSIVVDLLLYNLRDLLEDQIDSKLILLLNPYDDSLKYENYFSDFNVNILKTPSLTFPVTTIWKNVPLLPVDDYIEDIIKTIVSIHILEEEGDVMVFLPSVNEAKSTLVCLKKQLSGFHINDIECVLLHENSPNREWLNMAHRKKTSKRTIFFVTDCAELFVIPTVHYVIDSGLKQEYTFDHNKRLDILKTTFVSCNKAKLRKKIAGLFGDGKCYRLYNKDNFCKDMPANEYPEILTINPFNTMIKLFEYQPLAATRIEFVESLSESTKSRALSLLRKCNAIMDNKLTPLGQKIIKLPFPPLYSKLILLGIEWEIAYEAVIIIAFFLVKSKLFLFFSELELQREVDAVKIKFLQGDSDTLTYLYIYRIWLENSESASWCKDHFINIETLKSVKTKVNEICQIVGETIKRNIMPMFSTAEDSSSLVLELLFECFKENLCVYTGHYRSGYRMLSSRCISFLHPSTVICQTEDLPQFIIFDHMVSTKRDFLVHITSIPSETVMNALTTDALDFDYSDMFELSLVQRVIEPVGQKMINRVLLGKKGHKLKEFEQEIKSKLGTESLVLEPSLEKNRILVYALESFVDKAVQEVKDVLKIQFEAIVNLEKIHILELKKDQVIIPIELICLKGAKVKSVKIVNRNVRNNNDLKTVKDPDAIPYSIKKSIHLNWIRRKCTGEVIVKFSPKIFPLAKRFSMRHISLLESDVFVEAVEDYRENNLILSGVPEDADKFQIETGLRNIFKGITFESVILKYAPPFETSQNELLEIKERIEDECRKSTELIDFDVILPVCKSTATKMKAYINVSNDEDIEQAAKTVSKNFKNFMGIIGIPVYSSVIKCSLKICEALKLVFYERLRELEEDIKNKFPTLEQPFKFDIILVDENIPSIKVSANRIEILHILLRTIYILLEGDVLTKSFNKNINKIFCYGGSVYLRKLEDTFGVHIIDDYRTKSIRLYGSKEKSHSVKQRLLQFLLDAENEAVKTIPLATEGNNRILLKTLLVQYGVNLEKFIDTCQLRSAVLDIKSCSLFLHGNHKSIENAEKCLKDLANSIDLNDFTQLLEDEDICPVCFQPPLNLTFRLEMCGHLYCCECIQGLVDQAQFPIQCCSEDCNQDIIFDDICRILGDDQEKLNNMLDKSLKNYINEHQEEIYYCPTPDCSMFFYKKDIADLKLSCPLCLNDICVKCNVVYHQGFSCELYQGSKNDPDYSFKVWQKNSVECKRCPKCHSAIQKDGGCDHMVCANCKSHFCWICVQEFPSAGAVYQHIPFCTMYPRW